ncbi:MAG: FAD-dependent oxidoreductase [Marivibrio sp.]|uniref:FAD-dependent oxidoreductase n=1 Tax=Marivibrio sp. TaxID=2039719 RepID=UPI0032EFB1B7
MPHLKVAIVGSGPAGCYVAERLGKKAKGAVEVDVFDRLPTPFGLVRAGVAPDHQTTKAAARVMAKALEKPEVRFFGNVEIGRELSLDDLRQAYDAVVLAVGAPSDRALGVAGEDLPGVVGSGAFTRWINDHPAAEDRAADLAGVRHAVVIGAGNVAIDAARLLAKTAAEIENSDLSPEVEAALQAAPLETISIVARRGAKAVKFTPTELLELGELADAAVEIDPALVAGDNEGAESPPGFAALQQLASGPVKSARKRIRFLFNLQPEECVAGDDGRVAAMRFTRTDLEGAGENVDLPADLVVSCIGYRTDAPEGVDADGGRLANDEGRIDAGLYVVGWAKRGPSGTIGLNRAEAHGVADKVLEEVAPADRPGRGAILERLQAAGAQPVDWEGWGRIDAAETERAGAGRVRRKFTALDDMLAAAKGS